MNRHKFMPSYATLRRKVVNQISADIQVLASDSLSDDDVNTSVDEPVQHQQHIALSSSNTSPIHNGFNETGETACADVGLELYSDFDPNAQFSQGMNDIENVFLVNFDTDDDDDDKDESSINIQDELQNWVSKYNISQNATDALLEILRKTMPALPKCARSLLKTPKESYELKKMGEGEYCHVGLAKGLTQLLRGGVKPDKSCFNLQFNIDGLPLFKSTSTSLWPILCMVVNVQNKVPFIVGLFCGKEKPRSAKEYLSDFVAETKQMLSEGFVVDGGKYTISIHSFICDAPARAFVKGIKMHSGYSSCEKCVQVGSYIGKVVFPELDASLRTDDTFYQMCDKDHHVEECPIKELNVGCVTQFGLDYMHLICLGVMRRFILYWKGPVGPLHVRLGNQLITELSNKLVHAAQFTPLEFARKPRQIKEVLRWKATEFRQFLLYLGPVVLTNILQPQYFDHFMLLSVGIMLLVRKQLANDLIDYANSLLILFVQECEHLYGKESLVYNVHSVIHLAQDAKLLGCLDNFSSFPFENLLGQIKKLIRKPQHPIQQVLNRLYEKNCSDQFNNTSPQLEVVEMQCYGEHTNGVVPAGVGKCVQFKNLKLKGVTICINKQGNNYVLTKKGPAVVKNILKVQGDMIYVVCTRFRSVADAFVVPLPSSKLDIYKVSNDIFNESVVPVTEIVGKCVCVPTNLDETSFVLLPLFHHHY